MAFGGFGGGGGGGGGGSGGGGGGGSSLVAFSNSLPPLQGHVLQTLSSGATSPVVPGGAGAAAPAPPRGLSRCFCCGGKGAHLVAPGKVFCAHCERLEAAAEVLMEDASARTGADGGTAIVFRMPASVIDPSCSLASAAAPQTGPPPAASIAQAAASTSIA